MGSSTAGRVVSQLPGAVQIVHPRGDTRSPSPGLARIPTDRPSSSSRPLGVRDLEGPVSLLNVAEAARFLQTVETLAVSVRRLRQAVWP